MTTVIGYDIGHSSLKIEAASGKKRVSLLILNWFSYFPTLAT